MDVVLLILSGVLRTIGLVALVALAYLMIFALLRARSGR